MLIRVALQSFGAVMLVALFVRVFFVTSYAISGSSMTPTLLPGDFVAGFRGSASFKRGAVVALKCPHANDAICARRVIGLAGDRVEFKKGVLSLNGQAVESEPLSGLQDIDPVVVPPGEIYVLDDKRFEDEDSRKWGPIPAENVESKLSVIWMSLDWYDGTEVRTWPALRWSRLFHPID